MRLFSINTKLFFALRKNGVTKRTHQEKKTKKTHNAEQTFFVRLGQPGNNRSGGGGGEGVVDSVFRDMY